MEEPQGENTMPKNKIYLTYEFDDNGEKDSWEFPILITPELLDEYYGEKAIHKDLFVYLDFDLLVEDDETFQKWLKEKFYEEALEDYRRYSL